MKVQHTITIDKELLKEVKFLAIKLDMKYGEIIEKALREYIKKQQE